jgi:hypothetical protein
MTAPNQRHPRSKPEAGHVSKPRTTEQKAAQAASQRVRRATPESKAKHAAYVRGRRATPEGKAANAESCRRYRATLGGKAKIAESKRRRGYGLEPAEYAVMLSDQDGLCSICHRGPGMRALHVDHCHVTGLVRGLLCSPCNTAAGLLQDDPGLIRSLADYIERHAA